MEPVECVSTVIPDLPVVLRVCKTFCILTLTHFSAEENITRVSCDWICGCLSAASTSYPRVSSNKRQYYLFL